RGGGPAGGARPGGPGAAGAGHHLPGRGGAGTPRRAAGRRGPLVPRLLELRHVQELRGARRAVPQARRGDVIERRWEARLPVVLAAVLVVFGIAAVYGASSLVTTSGGQVGAGFAVRQ